MPTDRPSIRPSRRCGLLFAVLLVCAPLGCQDITTGPGDGRGDVELYDVDIGLDVDRHDGMADTNEGDGGGGGGGGNGPALPPPEPEDVPECEDSWLSLMLPDREHAPAEADSDGYDRPPVERRNALRSALRDARRNRWSEARRSLRAAGYEVCRSSDRTGELLVWYPSDESRGWARLAVRLDRDARPLFVQVPHPFSELGPTEQAVSVFTGVAARAILVAGAHRCANTSASRCDGTTDACGGPEVAFRNSDMANAPETFFQLFHRQTVSFFTESVVLSLHTYADRTGAILSNGTTEPADPEAPVARLGDSLSDDFSAHEISYCNRVSDRPRTDRDCGTTNLQGRFLNDVREVCTTSPDAATGRFLRLHHGLLDEDNPSGLTGPVRTFLETQ